MAESLSQTVYHSIIRDITYGRFSPGERLTETKLSNEYKASRSTIRETLRRLEGEGLIKLEEYKGITVSKPSIGEVEEIYNLRVLLEGYSVRLASEKMTKAHLQQLSDLNEKLKEAVRLSDIPGWIHNNILFHDFFLKICGNHNLGQILTNLKRKVYLYHYNIVSIPGHFKMYIKQHEAILKACQRHDGKMAEENMRAHIEMVKTILLDYLNKMLNVSI